MSNVPRQSSTPTRAQLEARTYETDPPPTREEIRRQMGQALIDAERAARPDRDDRD